MWWGMPSSVVADPASSSSHRFGVASRIQQYHTPCSSCCKGDGGGFLLLLKSGLNILVSMAVPSFYSMARNTLFLKCKTPRVYSVFLTRL